MQLGIFLEQFKLFKDKMLESIKHSTELLQVVALDTAEILEQLQGVSTGSIQEEN